MHEDHFLFKNNVSPLEIVLAWTVLLKDYVGSSSVNFFLTDYTSLKKLRSVGLEIDELETLKQLSKRLQEKISLGPAGDDAEAVDQLSLFQTHLYISDAESESKSVTNTEKSSNGDVEELTFLSLHGKVDFTLKCLISEHGRAIKVNAVSVSSACSSIQTLRILRQFEHILHQISLPPSLNENKLVYRISTASNSDIANIWKWNSTVPNSTSKTVLQIFTDHLKHHPNSPAVHSWDGDFSYAELDQLSTAFASHLTQLGVKTGNTVPLCFEKSKWTIVAILSVIKTGAAFVLLDENLPDDRLRQVAQIIEDETILVLSSSSQKLRAELVSPCVVIVDLDYMNTVHFSSASTPYIDLQTNPSTMVYIVFTSGSTGTPKAAMLSHSNICTFATLIGKMSDVTRQSKILALASYAYDVSLGNIFLSLLNGACLCIPSSWECKNDVARVVQHYQATHAMMTPSVSKILQPSESTSLEVLDLCGEPCSEDALSKWRGTRTRIMNTYGPAECTVTTVANLNVLLAHKPTIIGKGLGACWVMDPVGQDRLMPIGGIGELVLEGPLVGLGYLHNQKATEAGFLDSPQWLQDGVSGVAEGRRGRLYRTGDLVRYTDDGQIEYIGRRDTQVKIRGQRVELGEVTAHLRQHIPPSIQCYPEVARLKNGTELLVVFLVFDSEIIETINSTANDTLRVIIDQANMELSNILPPAMVPGAYTHIDRIPLTLTGKVDHRKLKQIGASLPSNQWMFAQKNSIDFSLHNGHHEIHINKNGSVNGNGYAHEKANGKVQNGHGPNISSKDLKFELLKRVLGEVLQVDLESIQSSDTFFTHGGESLSAIRFVSAAAQIGIQLDVSTIFKYPQLSDLADRSRWSNISFPNPPAPFSLLENNDILNEVALLCKTDVSNIEDVYPCTPLQEGLITARGSKSADYIGQGRFLLPDNIDIELFSRSWKRVASVHQIIRTRIVDTDSHGLFQVVLHDGNLFSGIQSQSLSDYMKQDSSREMSLGTELCRWGIVREFSSTYFVLTMHHSIYDGWTLPRIGAEVFRAYRGIRIEPSVGFNIFIEHIRSLPSKPAEEFWSHQLEEPEKTVAFPALPQGIYEPKADSVFSKTVPAPKNFHKGISMPSLLRAAWTLLVSKLSGSDDVIFGATVSGRNVRIQGIEDLLSPTISTIPVRVKIDKSTTIENFVASVQNQSLDIMPYENFGLQNIRKINSDTRAGSRFQTLLIVHPPNESNIDQSLASNPSERELKDILESLEISNTLSDFNEYGLMVLITQAKGHLKIDFSYDSRILSNDEIELLMNQFLHVVNQINQRNNLPRSLQELQFASENDIDKIWQWNSTQFTSTQEYIQDMVAKTTRLQPQAQAICAWDGEASFDDVNKFSSRLCGILHNKGIGRGNLVPICMEKSMWTTIAMLGILKSGAGFVAMDVKHQPKQRLKTILQQIQSTYVVTAGSAVTLAQEICQDVIILGKDSEDLDDSQSTPVPNAQSSPSDTAFLVFTSGSTGVPKGIIITHENFCSTISCHSRELKLSKDSRIYDFASYSFDIAVHNALMALCLGGCLCVPSEDERENDIEGSFERLRANWTDITPSVARLIDPSAIPGLETLILSGEAVGKDIVQRWADNVTLINAYGPAECQICTVKDNVKDIDRSADIGYAVGCTAWIVDLESDSLAPIGSIGELVIEGPIVSPGYLNAPNTAFIRDPQWLTKGSISCPGRNGYLYRTGDLARYRPDGTIVYCGRASTQIKINGQRVELDEVEFHVKKVIPGLREVVSDVVNFNEINLLTVFTVTNKTIGADTVPRTQGINSSLTVERIHPTAKILQSLKANLPSYMIPAVFLNTSHIPLTATRKVDRQKLKDLASQNVLLQLTQTKETFTDVEFNQQHLVLLDIWAGVLKVEKARINLQSDFFQLGGDSISAMRLVKYSRKKGISFTVADVFRHSQFEQLSSLASNITEENIRLEDSFDTIKSFDLISLNDKDTLISLASSVCNISQDEVVDIYPCTAFQEAVFALTAGKSSAYVQHTLLRFKDKPVLDRLLNAWDAVVASNAILRTRLVQSDAQLFQVVIRHQRQSWQWYDSNDDYLQDAAKASMGLGNLLFRFGLVRDNSTSSSGFTLIWTMHHAVYDAWSMDIILRQVSEYYHSQNSSVINPNYNIFVKFLQHQEQKSVKWWKSYLSGASNASLYPKVPMSSSDTLSDSLTRKEFSLPQNLPAGYSPAVLLRTAWAILMARHTGGESVVFGETRLGRNVALKGVDRMPGPTIASAPILVHVDREQTIKSLLGTVREDGIRMQDFEHLGLQNISKINEDCRAACNFQTLLVFLETEDRVDGDSIFEIDDTIDDIRNFNTNYLLIYFSLTRRNLITQAIFREPAISSGQVDLLLQQVQTIFSKLCTLPTDTQIQYLDVASEEDLAQIWTWNTTPAETVDLFIHELIHETAKKYPGKLAVLGHDGQMTYKQLDEYSDNLAAQLKARGIGLNSFVPLCFEKSFLVPVAMLAVIKTGAAFSVMDVSYPESRLKLITETLEARLVMTSSSQVELGRRLGQEIFTVDEKSYMNSSELHKQPVIESTPRNTDRLMYVCFTSGSTGVPKGVMVTHKNLASAAVAQARDLEFGPEDRIYDFSSHAFDANIWHFYLGFVIGSCICIPSHEDRMGNLAGSIVSFKSTALFLTPSVARTIEPKEVPTVKRLYLGGEAVTPLDVSMWKDSVDLWGAYGPTETTPLCIFTRLFTPELASNIGRGVGVRSWVCNPNNHEELMAIGAVGEMVNEGPLVTKGYYNQPDKTSKVFIQDPSFLHRGFQSRPGRTGRVYKTGDLVRYCYDGTIQYLGRADTQVKLRGQRVEYGEIEYHLKHALPNATSICEVVFHPSSNRPMLVAFYSLHSSATGIDKVGIRAYLSKRLPPYMIPEFFLLIPEVPRNPSGKIDRLKLKAIGPEMLQTSMSQEGESDIERLHGPLTEMETLLSSLWATALGQKDISISPNIDFVDVGGDSIAAMKLSNLARQKDLILTVKDIIQHSTVSSMALRILSVQDIYHSPKPFTLLNSPKLDNILINASNICGVTVDFIEDIYPSTPLQTELVALTMKCPQAYIKRSVYEVPSHINLDKLIDAWDAVFKINSILRTRFVEIEDIGLLQVVVKGHEWRTYDSLESYAEACTVENQDLGTLFSYLAIIDDKISLPQIVWTVHHALYDEWSTLIIEDQLRRAYQGRVIHSPPDFNGFVHYVLSQDQAKANAFWQNRLIGSSSSALYPRLPSGTYQVRPSQTFKCTINPDLGSGGNLQAKIHVAWALIVSKLSGSNDVIFAATLAGRNAAVEGIEQLVGPTITPVPIRIQLHSGKQQIQELIDTVEKETADMTPYQHVGMKNIQTINEDTRTTCRFQTLIVITPMSENGTSGLDSIRTSTYETHSKEGEAFHTFALVLFFFPKKDGLDIQVVYDPEVVSDRECERLVGRLENVITSLKDKSTVSDIECLGKEDLEDISKWNERMPESSEHLLHEVIIQSANQHPDKVAVDAWDCNLLYSQLDTMSARISTELRKYRIGRGSIIPILSPKSGYVPVAMLAVLRIGAAFLPLDGTQPLGRLKTIVDQVNPNVILTVKPLEDVALHLSENAVLIESCLESDINGTKQAEQDYQAQLDDVACILFTSGSTGVPKGVMQTHRALSSAVKHQTAQSGFTDRTRAFEFASYSFDVSWNMIFKILAVGGTLCVPNEDERQNDLCKALASSAATLTELTPSVARLLNPKELPDLETLILSGEPVHIDEFRHWKPKVHIVICYGPSECTSVSTMNPDLNASRDGIGKGSACLTWIVDPLNYHRLMPVGAVGEILIQGPIVGKGYYGNEKLTRTSYGLSDLPWLKSHSKGQNINTSNTFLSGDLARYDDNGNLHFVSRKDLQVKLHGQRIELEEVQHHVRNLLIRHVGPVICCVLGQENPDKEQRLAAFLSSKNVVMQGACELIFGEQTVVDALETLDEQLSALLPKYMVPSVYYFITSVPRTNNGKVDRKRLIQLAEIAQENQIYRGRSDRQSIRRKPSTLNEKVMQQLWANALGLPLQEIGADDNFFNLNGDSIAAMRLAAGARSKGFNLRVAEIFTTPKLSELAVNLVMKDKNKEVGVIEIRPFQLLGDSSDISTIRSEAAAKCRLSSPNEVEDIYPCTPLQESMLAATIKDPRAFISMRVYDIQEEIDEERLRNAWASVVNRHRIFRTRLVDLRDRGLNQVVTVEKSISWQTYENMGSFLNDAQDMNIGPTKRLTRWAFINTPHQRRLVWTVHHAAYDGWILPTIEDEIKKFYFGEKPGNFHLDMRPLISYILKQRKEESFAFWSKELSGALESTAFPYLPNHNYEPRPATYLEKTVSADLNSSSGISLSALLYGSWSTVVSHMTGNHKVSLGAILTGRNAPIDDVDKIVGPTVTTIPMLINVDPELEVKDFVVGLQNIAAQRIPHEHLGIHSIRSLNDECGAACNFQTVLVIQPPNSNRSSYDGKKYLSVMEELDETQIEGFPNQHAVLNQYGLMMEILPVDGKMTVRASFDSNLISERQIERMISSWEHILKQISRILNDKLSGTVGSLSSLHKKDLHDIWQWNKDVPIPVTEQNVCQIIHDIASQQPGALAIDAWDGQLTYSQLDLLSSQLARHLIASGVSRQCFIPLLFRKSMWTNVSMLAVLKAGCVFVPLDADHPEGHLRAIMQPLNAEIILCAAETRDRAARLAPKTIIVDAPSFSNENLIQVINDMPGYMAPTPEDIAYAVFTSGSTGAAKGVKISHKNLATAIKYQAGIQGYQINTSTRSLDSSSYSFDACVCNFFYTITQGGCLCIPSDESLKGDIGSFIREFRVNWAQLVPSVARTIDPNLLSDLKTLILTGEPLAKSDIETWCNRTRLVNAYGPTECTILCAISPNISNSNQVGNIGRGRGANLWLTEIGNPNKLAPIGAAGEILIEGPLIGAGYLGPYKYPVVEDPSWLLAGTQDALGRRGRLFRTGDQARYAEDGNIVFIRRIGSEIKLRGQRVDLLAVEDAIRRGIPSELEIAAEIAHINFGKTHDRQMLVVFVGSLLSCQQEKVEEKLQAVVYGLKSRLDSVLPAYLHPEAFIPLQTMPKTASGKMDRRRLKEVGNYIHSNDLVWINEEMIKRPSTPLSTDEERTLAAIWAELLGIEYESISKEDDFFRLGGDSLGVMRLTTKAHERGWEMKTSDVFKTPTLAVLAEKLTRSKAITAIDHHYTPYSLVEERFDIETFTTTHVAPTLNIDATQVEDIVPANGFQVDYMHNKEEPLGLQYAYLDISPETSYSKLVEACKTVVQTFQSLRSRFIYYQGKFYQVLLRDAPLMTEKIVTEEQITTFSNQFCPTDGRQANISDIFTKITLVETKDGLRRRVILRLSHMQNDGWCTIRIFKAIANVFNGHEIEKTPEWTDLLHYRSQAKNESYHYWKMILDGSKHITPPLVYRPGGSKVRTLRSYALPYFHDPKDNRRTRPTVVVNVAWALVLQNLSNQDDIVFGNVTTGRNGSMPGLDSVIGPCVNMLPFRLQLHSGYPDNNRKQLLRNLVEASAQQVDDRTSHEGLDWEECVDRCSAWPSGTRYSSAVHFRNMDFEPDMCLGHDRLTVTWYELAAEPHWTTVLVYPENDVLRLWLLANPAEISDDGADEILHMLSRFCEEIVQSLSD